MSFRRIFGIDVDSTGGVTNTRAFSSAVKEADKATGGLVSKMDLAGGGFKTLGGLAAIATAAVVEGTRQFVKYETALAEVNTLLGESQSIRDYSDEIQRLSKEFGSPAFEQAGATYQIISAGAKDAAEATNILTAANKLAVGGVTDINTAADGLTTILNAYNLEASSAGAVSDILFSTMRAGKTNIEELSNSLGLVVPTAAQLGVELPEVTAAIATLTTNGVATAQAVTQVNAAMTSILKPSKEATDLAAGLGIEFNTTALEAMGLQGFLENVAEATGGNADQMAKLFGSVEAVRAVLPLAGGSAEKFAEILKQNENAAGSTEDAYTKMADTTAKNFDRLTENFNNLTRTIGEDVNPIVNDLIDIADNLVTALQMSYDGLGLLIDLMSSDVPSEFNETINESIGIIDVLGAAFTDTELLGIALIRGLMLAWEDFKLLTFQVIASVDAGFDKLFSEVSEAAKSFIIVIADAMDALPEIFGVSSDGLRDFASNMRTTTDAANDYDAVMAEIKKAHTEATAAIMKTTDEMADNAIAVKLASAEQSVLKTRTSETTTTTKVFNKAAEEQAAALEDVKDEAVKTIRELEDLGDANAVITRTLEEYNKTQETSNKILMEATELYNEGKISLEELGVITGKYGETVEEVTSEVGRLWEQTTDSMYGHVEQFLYDGINGFDDFAESVKDTFKRMLASLAAQWIASGVSQWFGSALGGNYSDFSGFNPSNAFGGGSAGGTFGAILNAGSENGSGLTGGAGSGFANTIGNNLGLTDAQTQSAIDGAGSLLALYNGYMQIRNGNEVGGAIQLAGGGLDAYNAYQGLTGGAQLSNNWTNGIGAVGNVFGIYSGIKQGGIQGYGSAAYNAYSLYNTAQAAGWLGGGATASGGMTAAQLAAANGGSVVAGGATGTVASGAVAPAAAAPASGAAAPASGAAWGSALGATAGWITAGLLLDTYVGDGMVQRGFDREYDIRKEGLSALGDGDYSTFIKSQWEAPWESLKETFGFGSRSYAEILQEDYLPDLLGNGQEGFSALGANGEMGFAGGNAAVFGANYGIQGSGLTAQFMADGGENGNYAFFTGAQRALDGFEEYLNANGVSETRNEAGTLSATSEDVSVEMIRELWATYAEGLEEAVTAQEVFQTAIETGLLGMESHAKLFYENFAVGFGESATEARESLLSIDEAFDTMVANGIESNDALFSAISEHYGIAVEDAKFFVEQSGVATDQWVANFTEASGDNLKSLLDFNADGVTAFEDAMANVDNASTAALTNVGMGFGELGEIAQAEALRIEAVYRSAASAARSVGVTGDGSAESFKSDILALVSEVQRSNDLTSTIVRERR